MREEQLFEFDTRGVVVIRGALSPGEVDELNRALDLVQPAPPPVAFPLLDLGPLCVELMARAATLELLRSLIGDYLRFDHGLGIQMTADTAVGENLHGGPRSHQGSEHYQWVHGGMYNGLVVAMYVLADVNDGDGGFICVPGSHRANTPYRPPLDSPLVVNPAVRAGDMIVFTEALIHGTRQWRAEHRRRALVYKYAPGYLVANPYDSLAPYRELATTPLQRELLGPAGSSMRARLSVFTDALGPAGDPGLDPRAQPARSNGVYAR
ncbi:MAG TPA: phytanoyl-CoA dioxygenase family protein [Actinocrinis sp.]|nr:phytanoyl-CoA dioxygenase family protein [Actinocrinis sp.]